MAVTLTQLKHSHISLISVTFLFVAGGAQFGWGFVDHWLLQGTQKSSGSNVERENLKNLGKGAGKMWSLDDGDHWQVSHQLLTS